MSTLRPTLYSARWILPVDEPPLRNAALLVDARGRIDRVAPLEMFDSTLNVARLDFGDAAILPGLVNVHAHPELSVFRGLLEDLPFHVWIPTLMRYKREALLTAEDYDVAARWTCIESLRTGITTVGATEDSGAAVRAFGAAGMRGLVYLEVFGPAPEQADDSLAALDTKVRQQLLFATDRVRVGVSPHAAYTVSDELFARVAEYARAESLPLATHTAESEAEELLVSRAEGPFAAGLRTRGIVTRPRGRSTIDMLARVGIMDCAPLLIHAVRLSAADLATIAAAGASIAHCPIANARLGHGIAPIVEALERGITVAIGTDSVASNNRLDMLEEAHVAQALQRARLQSASALSSSELLRLVTIEGARILGMADEIGSLTSGKAADFCVVSLAGANTVPVCDPVAAVFHAARGSDVVSTAIEGRIVFDGSRVTTLSESELRAQLDAIAVRLSQARSVA